MKFFARLAFRNLGRRPVRTGLTVTAMACGTGLLITALSLLDGMIWDLVAGATENYHGHATVTTRRYLKRRRIQFTMPESAPPLRVFEDPKVLAHSARVRGYLLLSVGEGETSQSQPAELLGIDPESEKAVSRLPRNVSEGRFLKGTSGHEIVLGRGLAKRLGARLGDSVAAMGQAADGSIAAELFTVVGIFDSGDQIRDSSLALVGRVDLQEMLVLEDGVHEWVLALDEPLSAKLWADGMDLPRLEVSPWHHYLPQMSQMLDTVGAIRAIYAFVFYFAVLLITMNTMYMALLERVREFAIMGAVGLKPSKLAGLLLLEALMLSAIAGLLGGALGSGLSLLLRAHPLDFRDSLSNLSWVGASFEPVFRAAPTPEGILWPMAMTTLLGLLVAILPAWKLYRLRPVEVLREI